MGNNLFRCVKSFQSTGKRDSKNRLCNEGILKLLAEGGAGGATITLDCLKKANCAIKLTALEHYVSYNCIIPFLTLLKSKNKGLQFKVEKDELSCDFKRLAILFPYSVHAKEHCFKVYGVDSAFLDGLEIKGQQRLMLKKYVPGIPLYSRLMFKRYFLSAISGRTLNNEMIIFAISINDSECSSNYDFLFDFLKENEVNYFINN